MFFPVWNGDGAAPEKKWENGVLLFFFFWKKNRNKIGVLGYRGTTGQYISSLRSDRRGEKSRSTVSQIFQLKNYNRVLIFEKFRLGVFLCKVGFFWVKNYMKPYQIPVEPPRINHDAIIHSRSKVGLCCYFQAPKDIKKRNMNIAPRPPHINHPQWKKVPGLLVAPREEGRGPLIWRKRPTKLHAFPNYSWKEVSARFRFFFFRLFCWGKSPKGDPE